MMIARTSRVKRPLSGSLFFALVGILGSTLSFAQGYSNPRYQGNAPKKGDSVPVPSYSTPAQTTPTYSTGYETGEAAVAPSSEHRMALGVNFRLPVGVGDAGGGLKSRFGGDVQLFLQPFLSDDFRNYLSVGWDQFQLKSDTETKLNLIPFTFGLEFAKTVGRQFNPQFGIAIGGAYGWIGVPNSQNINGRAYFLAQLKPGLDIDFDRFSIVFQTPVSFLIGTNKMTYLAYSLGVRFGL